GPLRGGPPGPGRCREARAGRPGEDSERLGGPPLSRLGPPPILEPGGAFRASVCDHRHGASAGDAPAGLASSVAQGSWRPCRGGVELVFPAEPALDLPELCAAYRRCRDCLVAEDFDLPDGLAQEYSPCWAASPPPSGEGAPRAWAPLATAGASGEAPPPVASGIILEDPGEAEQSGSDLYADDFEEDDAGSSGSDDGPGRGASACARS
ncbi:unnamed protein product, partial [Prorocentrum cordatum]